MTGAATLLARLAGDGRIAGRAMILLAHPDDETIGLGAQLRRFDDALLVHVTDGAPRDGDDARRYGFAGAAEYAKARRGELTAAMRAGEAERVRMLCLEMPDKEAMRGLAGLSRQVAEFLTSERPRAVFTHAYEGGHPDHDACAFAARAACRLVAAPTGIVEMPFYHRSGSALILGHFVAFGRKSGSADPAAEQSDNGSQPSPGRHAPAELALSLKPDELRRKRAMVECFATQSWLLQQFDLAVERFRLAPEYDFASPPHPGELHYETLGWGIAGAAWREEARRALRELGLADVRCR